MSTGGIGHRLRWARDRARLTQELLAERGGISRTWLTRIECGQGEPRASDLAMLYEVLTERLPSLSLEWLMTGRGEALDGGPEALVGEQELLQVLMQVFATSQVYRRQKAISPSARTTGHVVGSEPARHSVPDSR